MTGPRQVIAHKMAITSYFNHHYRIRAMTASAIARLDTKRPPAWMVCNAEDFEHRWLVRWERGEIPRPSPEEMAIADQWLVSESDDEINEGNDLS